jgi:drug/metabolite transporter (DMT)-like permease
VKSQNAVKIPDAHNLAPAAIGVGDIGARLMLVILCLIWGVTWPVMKIALDEVPPLSMRASTAGIGAVTLLAICTVKRRSLRIPNAKTWAHVFVAALLNIVSFSVLSAFAQMATETSRVAILTYTMPIWAVLLAWPVLGERPTRVQAIAVVSCTVGLVILISPLAAAGLPLGALLAVGAGLAWAAGTVYLKWARINADPIGVTSWQLTISFFAIAACMLVFEGGPHFGDAHADGLFALMFSGMFGTAIAYAMWFDIVPRVPAATASLGVLGAPVVGVVATVLIIGDRLTAPDIIGFALIFAASACAVLGSASPRLVLRRPTA